MQSREITEALNELIDRTRSLAIELHKSAKTYHALEPLAKAVHGLEMALVVSSVRNGCLLGNNRDKAEPRA